MECVSIHPQQIIYTSCLFIYFFNIRYPKCNPTNPDGFMGLYLVQCPLIFLGYYMSYTPENTALLLIGFQNDYLSEGGALNSVIEHNVRETGVLENTLRLIDAVKHTEMSIINTPILFSSDYNELLEPKGLMAKIKEIGAFQRGAWGGEVISQLQAYGDRITLLQGKTWFSSFQGTNLQSYLNSRNIQNIVLAGVVTSLCIDSTARAASDLGYTTSILSDCTGARSMDEQQFYCESIFPLYTETQTVDELLEKSGITATV